MKPIILDATKSLTSLVSDKTNGLGRLSDCLTCVVSEDLNSAYTAKLTYPVSGMNFDKLVVGALLKIKPNLYDDAQIFRIESISKPINEIVTVNLNHISYDLRKSSVLPFSANGGNMTMIEMKNHMQGCDDFSFSTNISDTSTLFENTVPQSARSLIGGATVNFLNTFGGEVIWDNLNVNVVQKRGNDNGVTIRYGVDLTDLTHDETLENTYTHVQPYITVTETQEEGGSVQKTILGDLQTVIDVSSANMRILNLDLSSNFTGRTEEEGEPTKEEINSAAQTYIQDNNIGVPTISMSVSFIPLWQTEEYKDIAPLKRVSLGDTVHIVYNRIGIQAEARVNAYEWNVLTEMYNSLSLGDVKSTLQGTIAGIENDISSGNIGGDKPISVTDVDKIVQDAIDKATELLTGAYGGYMVIGTNADGQPNELFFMDTNDKATATKVIRLNSNGIGASVTGINGPYIASMLIDGTINASQITFGELDGNLIKANTIMAGALDEVLNNKIDKNIQSVKVQYAMNTSQTDPPLTGWQDDAPEWQEGHYIWQRTETMLADGTTTYSDALCITGVKGSDGADGKDGEDGKDAIVLFIDSSNGTMFKNSAIATTLTVTIVYGDAIITNSTQMHSVFGENAALQWKYKRMGETEWTPVPSTDPDLNDEGFIYTIQASDVLNKTVFSCELCN